MATASGADGGYMDLMTCEQAAHVIMEAGGASGEYCETLSSPPPPSSRPACTSGKDCKLRKMGGHQSGSQKLLL